MRIIAPMMILIMMTSTLAGCTGGDPDGGGNDEINMEILNQLIDDNLEDFVNNTTVDVTNNFFDSDNSTTINYINGTSTVTSVLHTMASQQQGLITQIEHTGGDLVLLVREDAFPQEYANSVFDGLDGASICASVGSEMESQLVIAFSSRNIGFTTVGTADMAEATDKIISGECDALAGDRSSMIVKKNTLDSETSIQGGTWITNTVTPYASSYDFSNFLEISITQERGFSTEIIEIFATVSVVGNCINCTNNESNESIDNYLETFIVDSINPPNNHPLFFDPAYGSSGVSSCELSLEENFSSEGLMFGPGLQCEHKITFEVGQNALSADYEYTWSDWTYYIHWSSNPIVMH